jgi:hypothetical protein
MIKPSVTRIFCKINGLIFRARDLAAIALPPAFIEGLSQSNV